MRLNKGYFEQHNDINIIASPELETTVKDSLRKEGVTFNQPQEYNV